MKITTLLAASAITITAALPAAAQELSFANFTPPFHTVNASVIEKMNADLSALLMAKLRSAAITVASWAQAPSSNMSALFKAGGI